MGNEHDGRKKGYILNFYKYAAADIHNFEEEDKLHQNDIDASERFIRSVVWSQFDRIEIRDIEKFDDYRLSKSSEKTWVGERQFLLLYEINPGNRKLTYQEPQETTDLCLFGLHSTKKDVDETRYRFYGISIIDFTPEVHEYFYDNHQKYSKIIYKELSKAIDEIKKLNSDKKILRTDFIEYEIYGTLGGNDLVIIWLSNQYVDIITMVEALKKSTANYSGNYSGSIFNNISTIIGFRDINNKNIIYSGVEGKLNIRLTKKNSYNDEIFMKSLAASIGESPLIYTVSGEHDITFMIGFGEWTPKFYSKKGLIHYRNPVFYNNILQANTQVVMLNNYKEIIPFEFEFDLNRIIRKKIKITEKHSIKHNIENITQNKMFDELPYLKETIWLLYEDYMKIISSSFSYPWMNDFHIQFEYSVIYFKDLIESDSNINLKYETIEILINVLRQTILHVSQANRLFFEIPNTHLKNTGNYSKILRTYYGIVKLLISQVYSIPRHGKQSLIIPFITFDVTPKIESLILPKIHKNNDDAEFVIINIKLPYDALVNIPKYTKLLAHEIYHYAAPSLRLKRNDIFGIIYLSEYLIQIIEILILAFTGEEHIISLGILKRKAIETVIHNYMEIEDSNYEESSWNTYYNWLEKQFGSTLMPNERNLDILYKMLDETMDYNLLIELKMKESSIEKLNIDKLKFLDWFKKDRPYRHISCDIINNILLALREVAADFFMIKIMGKGQEKEEYYQLNNFYRKLFNCRESEAQFVQDYRIGLITDYFFREITESVDELNKKWIEELNSKLGNFNLDKDAIDYICVQYSKYFNSIGAYRKLIFQYFDLLEIENIVNQDDDDFKTYNKITTETIKDLKMGNTNNFNESIIFIERFQVQENIIKTSEKNESRITIDKLNKEDIIHEFEEVYGIPNANPSEPIFKDKDIIIANNVESLIQCIREACKRISDEGKFEPLWYRGHSSHNYKLIPSLFRMQDEKELFYSEYSPSSIMKSLFNMFQVRSFGAKEIYPNISNPYISTLATMQHYKIPTNVLDWSTSALTALYFAVEKQMVYNKKHLEERSKPKEDAEANKETETKDKAKPKEDAELWILNPSRLNKAREYMNKKDNETLSLDTIPIPTACDNEEDFYEFIPQEHDKFPKGSLLPLAVYVPHVNARIKAQLGTFTMFSLSDDDKRISKKIGDNKGREFKNLLDMQVLYRENYADAEPFLSSIRISKSCINDVADWLRVIGITKPIIYPELDSISEHLVNEIKGYIKVSEDDKSKTKPESK